MSAARDEKAKSFGQYVMIGTVVTYMVVAWFVAQLVGATLGDELVTLIGLILGLFVIAGAQWLGERAEWWLTARRRG